MRRTLFRAKQAALNNGSQVAVRDWMIVELGLFAGLRVQEMQDLKCGDFILENGQSSLIVRKGKGGKRRVVRFNGEFKKSCLEYLDRKRKNDEGIDTEDCFFVSTHTGKSMSRRALQKSFKRSVRKAKLPGHYSIHCLWHTFGAHLYKASGYNLRLVQEQLGHASIKTTEVYASVMNPDVEKAVERLYR